MLSNAFAKRFSDNCLFYVNFMLTFPNNVRSDCCLTPHFPSDAEFDELSDIDGDDSAVISQCNSSLSWTSLDAKQLVFGYI